MWYLKYEKPAADTFRRLDSSIPQRIKTYMAGVYRPEDPTAVGNYCLICRIEHGQLLVSVVTLGHTARRCTTETSPGRSTQELDPIPDACFDIVHRSCPDACAPAICCIARLKSATPSKDTYIEIHKFLQT